MLLTFVIPVASYHEAAVERAAASVMSQSLPAKVVVVRDHDHRGAGAARNQGLAQVDTPFVAFLDADDWIEPTWAEETLRAYDGRHYIYTDHFKDDTGVVERVSDTAWDGTGAWHVITALIPTMAARRIGGFDESLPGFEDTDFYWHLTRSGVWGKHLPRALFHYGKGGQRAQAFRDRADRDTIAAVVMKRYEGYPMSECAGCGANPNLPSLPMNEPQPGDVLALSLWRGNRIERGKITGRVYRGGWNKPLWVAPEDIDADARSFARVVEMPPPLSDEDIDAFRTFARDTLGAAPVPVSVPDDAAKPAAVQPDVRRVLALAGRKSAPRGAYIDTENFP